MADGPVPLTPDPPVPAPVAGDTVYAWPYLAVHAGAGFALVFLTLLASDLGILAGLLAAVVSGVVLGRRLPGLVAVTGGGALAAVLAYGAIGGRLAAGPGFESQSLYAMVDTIATGAILLAVLVNYLATARRHPPRPATAREDTMLAVLGLALAAGATLTLLVLALSPATRSFQLPLESGWVQVIGDEGWDYSQTRLMYQGREAVYIPADRDVPPASVPVALVGVLSRSGSSYGCPVVFDPWPGSPLLDGELVESGDVVLEAGPALRIHSRLTVGDSDAYLYFLERTRVVGFAREDLCYLVAVVAAPGEVLDPAVPDALAAAFRFR